MSSSDIADLAIHEQPGCGVEQPAPAFFRRGAACAARACAIRLLRRSRRFSTRSTSRSFLGLCWRDA
jgi:hypothetical protein